MKINTPIKTVCKTDYILQIKNLSHWQNNTSRQQEYEQHKYTETIFLRFRKDLNVFSNFTLIDYPLMDIYKKSIKNYINTLKQFYKIKDYSVIIANLKPNGTIPLHYDYGDYFEKSHRVHIPIKTNTNVLFTCGDVVSSLKTGFIYEIDNVGSLHGVEKKSNEDRYHVIFDIWD